ncbi:MAG: tetratricopeptide repeat protein [Bacteroidota bacterium]
MILQNQAEWDQLLLEAEKLDPKAQYEVGQGYDWGIMVDEVELVVQDKEKAYFWYRKSSENGNIEATVRLADYLSEGEGCEQDIDQAIELYQRVIAEGSSIAAFNLGTIYRDQGEYVKAYQSYSLASRLSGVVEIQVGYCQYYGVGAEQNRTAAYQTFKKVSEDESNQSPYDRDQANYYLGKMYLEGEVVDRSISMAKMYLNQANTDDDHDLARDLLFIIGTGL